MLKAGYTAVCEFHYLHNQPDGQPYADRGAMSQALIDAATTAGIGLTLLPTLYQTCRFRRRPADARANGSSCSRRTDISTSSIEFVAARTRNRRRSRSASLCTACALSRRDALRTVLHLAAATARRFTSTSRSRSAKSQRRSSISAPADRMAARARARRSTLVPGACDAFDAGRAQGCRCRPVQ